MIIKTSVLPASKYGQVRAHATCEKGSASVAVEYDKNKFKMHTEAVKKLIQLHAIAKDGTKFLVKKYKDGYCYILLSEKDATLTWHNNELSLTPQQNTID